MILKAGKYAVVAGYVPRDAELRTTQNGHNVCNFSVKAAEITDESGQKVITWMNCVAWRDVCDVARYFRKGDNVLCAGEMTTRSYTAQNGEQRTVTELVCEFAVSCKPSPITPMFPEVAPKTETGTAIAELEEVLDDDLPF